MADNQEVQTDSADSSYERAQSLMKKELPEYVVNIFMACGYDRLESIAKMDHKTIDEMIAYTNSTFVTGFVKTIPILAQQLKSILWLNIKATLSYYPGTPSTWV